MTPTPNEEGPVVLDACVLVPMALCDILLRCAEEPALYRVAWSEEILREVERTINTKLGYTKEQAGRRIGKMREAFPEAMVDFPVTLLKALDFVPDPNDRHVAAAAIHCQARAIVTSNLKDFPSNSMTKHDILVQSPDAFLTHQFHLDGDRVMEALDTQASAIGWQRIDVIKALRIHVPKFAELVSGRGR